MRRASLHSAARWSSRFAAGLTPFLVCIFLPAVARAADQPTLVVSPAQVALPADGTARILVTLQGPVTRGASEIALHHMENGGVSVARVEMFKGAGCPAWEVLIRAGTPEALPGEVTFFADPGEPASEPAKNDNQANRPPDRRVALASLKVTHLANPVEDPVSVEFVASLGKLHELKDSYGYLLIESKLDVPLRIDRITHRQPDFLGLSLEDSPTSIGPRHAAVVPVRIKPSDSVVPGKHLLVFTVEVRWGTRDDQARQVTKTQEVEVGVFGESEVLTALGVPSFLLLPGFLFLLTFRLFWSIGKTKEQREGFPLPAKSAEFWGVAITLSIGMALLYPLLSPVVFRVRREYLVAHGVKDFAFLWVFSILAGLVTFGIFSAALALWRKARAAKLAAKTLTLGDQPLVVLRKLGARGERNMLPTVTAKLGETEVTALLYGKGTQVAEDGDLIGPPLEIHQREGAAEEAWAELQAKLESNLKEISLESLAETIERNQAVASVRFSKGFAELGEGLREVEETTVTGQTQMIDLD